jgi:hypothetical protein
MGGTTKQSDYKASEAEKASASVAMAEYEYFKKNYDPLLQEMRDKSLSQDVKSSLRGRANADVMQALSGPSLLQATSSTPAGDMSQALSGQLNTANISAKQIENTAQTNVLGTARKQQSDASTGMAEASRLATSSALERAKANQQVAQARFNAAAQVGSTFVAQGLENMGTQSSAVDAATGEPMSRGTFFSPVNQQGQKVSGLKNRLGYSQFFGG